MTAPKSCGVYAIVHKPSGKRYVGSSVNIVQRIRVHKATLRSNSHANRYLQSAWKAHGEDQFEFKTLLICSPADKIFYEQKVMDAYNVTDKNYGYNLSLKAYCPTFTPETHKKRGEKMRGRPSPLKGIKRGPSILRGVPKGKPSWNKGIPLSEETKKKLSEKLKGRKVWNKGIPATEEVRQKISAANKGKTSWNKGVPTKEETKEKFRESRLGKKTGPYKSGNAIKTHCNRGHPYSGENLYIHPNANRRGCRACLKLSHDKQKELRAGVSLP